QVEVYHPKFGRMKLYCQNADQLLFTENNSNNKRVFGTENETPFVKDAFHSFIVDGKENTVNPNKIGTKVGLHYKKKIKAGGSETICLRFSNKTTLSRPFEDFE